MSKLYEKYLQLKKDSSNTIYLFKSGIFYISIQEDAELLANEFSFKITNLNEEIIKCGFPQTRLGYYIQQLQEKNIKFQIIDPKYEKIQNNVEYVNNENIKRIINEIAQIDLEDTSYKEAYGLLEKIQNAIKSDLQIS